MLPPSALRRPGWRGPCGDVRPEWRGLRAWTCGRGSRASCGDGGCWAGRCACSRCSPLGLVDDVKSRLDLDGAHAAGAVHAADGRDRRSASATHRRGIPGRDEQARDTLTNVKEGPRRRAHETARQKPTDAQRYARAEFSVKPASTMPWARRRHLAAAPRVCKTSSTLVDICCGAGRRACLGHVRAIIHKGDRSSEPPGHTAACPVSFTTRT